MAPNPPIVDDEIPSAAKWNSGVYRYSVDNTELNVVSSAAATNVLSFTVGAGHLSTARIMVVTIEGDHLNNLGGGAGWNIRLKYGGTTLIDYLVATAASATRQSLWLQFAMGNRNATNVQFARLLVAAGNAASTVTAGLGLAPVNAISQNGTAAVDSTLAQTLTVEVQNSTSSASLSFRKQLAYADLG